MIHSTLKNIKVFTRFNKQNVKLIKLEFNNFFIIVGNKNIHKLISNYYKMLEINTI